MNKKVIAKELCPSNVDFRYYFDDDGLKSVGGKNCAVYIIPADRRRYSGFNMEEYEEIKRTADSLIEAFEEVSQKTNIIQHIKLVGLQILIFKMPLIKNGQNTQILTIQTILQHSHHYNRRRIRRTLEDILRGLLEVDIARRIIRRTHN